MLPISFVVLTLNEELDLPACLDSLVGFSDDVVILDSGSTDGTHRVASERGIPVYQHAFTDFGSQRNWALDNIPSRYEWNFHLDADERFTPNLASEIVSELKSGPDVAGYYVPNRLMLGRHWLRYSSGYPVYQVRLFHRERLRFERYGHGQREITCGKIGKLREPYDHFGFSKGLSHWLHKHVEYARMEADQAIRSNESVGSLLRKLVSSEPAGRRRAVKQLSHRLPCRATLRFFYTLVLQRGLLDGRAGITYARMLAVYEAMTPIHMAWKQLDD